MSGPRVAVVLASIDAASTIAASVRGFLAELGDRGSLHVADASRDRSAALARAVSRHVGVSECPPGTLAPVLWREGLTRTEGEVVAFSTAQMVPRRGWLDGLLAALDGNAAGVGGPIAAGPRLSATDRALYLLRYANYLPPVPESPGFDPPGDNAAYRRRDLDAVPESWADGFWEARVHRRLRALGRSVAIAPGAVVEFRGGSRFRPALGHRLAHARHYGASRAEGVGFGPRLARTLAAPAVPPLLLARIVRNLRSRGEPLGAWLPALPHLGGLLATWSLGEAAGALLGPGKGMAA